jgi:type IV secretory pathway VirB2 component (pilin)
MPVVIPFLPAIRRARWIAQLNVRDPAVRRIIFAASPLLVSVPLYAQAGGGDPWDNAVNVLQAAFISTIARSLSLVSICSMRN